MALWRWHSKGWERVRALPPYLPPRYLHIRKGHLKERDLWLIRSDALSLHGADELPEALEGLLAACRRPGGGGNLWEVLPGRPPREVNGIRPFSPESLWDQGIIVQKLRRPLDRWLLSLQLARPEGRLFVSRWERYVASWRVLLESLLRATEGRRGAS